MTVGRRGAERGGRSWEKEEGGGRGAEGHRVFDIE